MRKKIFFSKIEEGGGGKQEIGVSFCTVNWMDEKLELI
jgi:hypothetical protein